jgi:sigma-B regulation protein RsbU (phosphoserine phosphatase)
LLDVSGHGLRASLPSLAVINLLRSRGLSNVDYYQPNEVLKGLNQTFQMSDRNDKYFTIWYGVYDRYSRSLTYSSAGHPPAILLTPTSQLLEQRLKTPGVPIGMFPNIKYINASCQVAANSSLYIFSDGIYEVEPQADVNAHWGLERLINLLKKYQKNPERDLKRLLQYVRTWHPNFQFEDDLSILQIDFS